MPESKQITCVTTEHPHRHITAVGVGATWTKMSVTAVRSEIDAGVTFFTKSPSTGKIASVHKYQCQIAGCGVSTLKSSNDAIQDNNLDNLPVCP